MLDQLQTVYERARVGVGEENWPRLTAHEQTTAVYEQLRALEHGVRIRVAVTSRVSAGVDRPEDVALVEKMLRG